MVQARIRREESPANRKAGSCENENMIIAHAFAENQAL
jgi:hypothetical protein